MDVGTAYGLLLDEIYPRRGIMWPLPSADGERVALVQLREVRVDEVGEGEGRRLRPSRLADVCLLPAGGGDPQPLFGDGTAAGPAVWAPDGRRLVCERQGHGLQVVQLPPAVGGSAAAGATLEPPRTILREPLYRPPLAPGDLDLGLPRWAPDGQSLLVAVRDGPCTQLLQLDAGGRWRRELLAVEGYLIGWDWAPDGSAAVVVTREEDGWRGEVGIVELGSGAWRRLCTEEDYEYAKPAARWSPDGTAILLRSNRSGWAKLWRLQPRGGQAEPLTTGAWDEGPFRFLRASQLSPGHGGAAGDGTGAGATAAVVVFASRAEQEGSGDDLWTTGLTGGAPVRLTAHPGVNYPLGGAAGRVLYWHSSPTEPGDLWTVPAAPPAPSTPSTPSSGGAAGGQRLTHSAPVFLERKLRAPEHAVTDADDGTRVPLLVYRPAYGRPGQPFPAVVWLHGGPTGEARWEWRAFHSWLANLGYVVVVPNFRGSVGHGVAFMRAVAGDGVGKADLADTLAAARYARTLPDVDTSRGLGVGGVSWGGYLTLMAVTRAPHEFACAVAGAAIADWTVQQAETEVRYYDRWLLGGWLYQRSELAVERSPITHAERLKTPLLVLHGEADRDVPFAQIGPFVEQARRTGTPVQFKTYPLEGHGNIRPQNRQDFLDRTRRFLARHLQPWNFRDNPSENQVQY